MSKSFSRVAAVVAGAVIVASAGGAGAAVAGKLIGSADIKDESIKSKDIRDGQVRAADLSGKVNADIAAAGESNVQTTELAEAKAITHIGGPINDNFTDLDTGLTLAPGTYTVTVSGSFESANAAADGTPAVYPQLSLWLDKNNDGDFTWQDGEGDISPNAEMPAAAKRHISVSGTTVITLTEETPVKLLGFGYDANQGSARSGEINVTKAVLVATKIS